VDAAAANPFRLPRLYPGIGDDRRTLLRPASCVPDARSRTSPPHQPKTATRRQAVLLSELPTAGRRRDVRRSEVSALFSSPSPGRRCPCPSGSARFPSRPRGRSRYRSLGAVRSRRIDGVSAGAPRALVDDRSIHAQLDLGRVDGAITAETDDFDNGLGRCGTGSAWGCADASGRKHVRAVEVRNCTPLRRLRDTRAIHGQQSPEARPR
jgi:hypothetical protein